MSNLDAKNAAAVLLDGMTAHSIQLGAFGGKGLTAEQFAKVGEMASRVNVGADELRLAAEALGAERAASQTPHVQI